MNHTIKEITVDITTPYCKIMTKIIRNKVLIVIPTGIVGTASTTYDVPFWKAINNKLMRIFEGKFVNNPPILLPYFSANKVAAAIHNPAMKNESITLVMNILSMLIFQLVAIVNSERSNANYGELIFFRILIF